MNYVLNKQFCMLKIHFYSYNVLQKSLIYSVLLFCCLILIDLILQAHEQLRAVLQTLLEELPSDLPILLLGTSSVPLAEIEDVPSSIFSLRYVYAFLCFLKALCKY